MWNNGSGQNGNITFVDALSILSFIIAIANYDENLGQTKAQELLDNVLDDIHHHLRQQDEKIDKILEQIERKG